MLAENGVPHRWSKLLAAPRLDYGSIFMEMCIVFRRLHSQKLPLSVRELEPLFRSLLSFALVSQGGGGGGPVNRLQRAVACIGEFSLYFWNFSLENTIDQNLTDHAWLQPDHSQSLLFRLQEERLLCMTFRTILPLLLSLPSAHPISTLQTPFPPSSFHSSSCSSPFLYSQSRISCCSIPTLFPFSKHSATRGIRLIW